MKTLEQIREEEQARLSRRKVDMGFKIDPDIERRLRKFTVLAGMSMSGVVCSALKDYLDLRGVE